MKMEREQYESHLTDQWGEHEAGGYEVADYPKPLPNLWRQTKNRLIDYCVENDTDLSVFDKYVTIAGKFYDGLDEAFMRRSDRMMDDKNKYFGEPDPKKWLWHKQPLHHNFPESFFWQTIESESIPSLEELKGCIGVYLAHPWLQDSWLDWAFLDSYVWCEMVALRDQIAMFRWKLFYSFEKKELKTLRKAELKDFAKDVGGVLLRYVLPIGVLSNYWVNQASVTKDILIWATGVYGLYLAFRIIDTPGRYRRKKEIDEETFGRLRDMGMVYQTLHWPVSLENCRSIAYAARKNGVVFSTGFFSLLDNLEARSQIILDPSSTSDAYK